MCVIFWSIDHPDFDLVVASNRDEFLRRPTLPATWHCFSSSSDAQREHTAATTSTSPSDSHPILSARDSTGGGTWLGITRNGAFATLTNFTERNPELPDGLKAFASRGELVREWLIAQSGSSDIHATIKANSDSIQSYLEGLGPKLDHYPGFNLLIGGLDSDGVVLGYTTNRTATGQTQTHKQPDLILPSGNKGKSSPDAPAGERGCLRPHIPASREQESQQAQQAGRGMSNSILQDPWPKVSQGSAIFDHALSDWDQQKGVNPDAAQEQLVEHLFDLLWTSSTPPPSSRPDLRKSVLISPLPIENPRGQEDWYATRTSTVILVRKPGGSGATAGSERKATFVERDVFRLDPGSTPVRVSGPNGIAGREGSQRRFAWTVQ